MSGDSSKGHGTTLAKRGVFFQICLHPGNDGDQRILTWLRGIRKRQRSRKVREAVLKAIDGGLPSQAPGIRSASFQFYLNPKRETDQRIILWLAGIPKRMRSQRVKGVLLMAVGPHAISSSAEHRPPQPDAGQFAVKLFGSIRNPKQG